MDKQFLNEAEKVLEIIGKDKWLLNLAIKLKTKEFENESTKSA